VLKKIHQVNFLKYAYRFKALAFVERALKRYVPQILQVFKENGDSL